VGCGGDHGKSTSPAVPLAPPTDLAYRNGDGAIFLEWSASPDDGTAGFQGYVLYRDTQSMAGLSGTELELRLLTVLQATTYEDEVDNGVRYYYAVRAIRDDGTLSDPTAEIDTAARAVGQARIWEFADSVEPSGFELSTGDVLPMTAENIDRIDLYLGTTERNDDASGLLAIKSPHLVASAEDWSSRVAGMKLIGSWDDPTTTPDSLESQVTLGPPADAVGKVLAIRTPEDAGGQVHFAKIRILSVTGAPGDRSMEIEYAYQAVPDYIRFRRPR
jgi:hypothetical protein